MAAMLLAESGQPGIARNILLAALQKEAGTPFAGTICLIATRLGIRLPPPAK
jgi:hypothetical protein